MHHNSRDSWMDAVLWGTTAAILVLSVGVSCVLYFGAWIPGNH